MTDCLTDDRHPICEVCSRCLVAGCRDDIAGRDCICAVEVGFAYDDLANGDYL